MEFVGVFFDLLLARAFMSAFAHKVSVLEDKRFVGLGNVVQNHWTEIAGVEEFQEGFASLHRECFWIVDRSATADGF